MEKKVNALIVVKEQQLVAEHSIKLSREDYIRARKPLLRLVLIQQNLVNV